MGCLWTPFDSRKFCYLIPVHSVIVHKYSSILSAYGIALADVAVDLSEPSSETYSKESHEILMQKAKKLKKNSHKQLLEQGVQEQDVIYEVYLNMRYQGSDTSLMILQEDSSDFLDSFRDQHQREFSFLLDKPVLVDDVYVCCLWLLPIKAHFELKHNHVLQPSARNRSQPRISST